MPRASLEVFCFYCTTITLKVGSRIDAISIHFPAFKPDMFEFKQVRVECRRDRPISKFKKFVGRDFQGFFQKVDDLSDFRVSRSVHR